MDGGGGGLASTYVPSVQLKRWENVQARGAVGVELAGGRGVPIWAYAGADKAAGST